MPPAMLPIDYDVVDGKRVLRPVVQIALDGMVNAGIEMVVFVVNEANLPVMRYFRSGEQFGVSVAYVWARGEGLAMAVDSAYTMMKGHTVLMTMPGVMDKKSIIGVLNRHQQGAQALTVSVAPNVIESEGSVNARGLQLTGVYAWSPKFTEYLRESMLARPKASFDDIVIKASSSGVLVSTVKFSYTPLVNSTTAYTKVLKMEDPAPAYEPDDLTVLHSEP